jgi:hypothetical protein
MRLFHLIEVRDNYPPLWRAEEIARVAALPAQRSDRRRAQPCWLACALPKVTSESRQLILGVFVSHLTSSPTILCRFLLLFDLPLHPQLLQFLASRSYTAHTSSQLFHPLPTLVHASATARATTQEPGLRWVHNVGCTLSSSEPHAFDDFTHDQYLPATYFYSHDRQIRHLARPSLVATPETLI